MGIGFAGKAVTYVGVLLCNLVYQFPDTSNEAFEFSMESILGRWYSAE